MPEHNTDERAEDKLSASMKQTKEDRECILELRTLTEEERRQRIGELTLAVVENFASKDPFRVSYRLERLYASLSINIEPYDKTRMITLTDLDQAISLVRHEIRTTASPEISAQSEQAFGDARRLGLNPIKQTEASLATNQAVALHEDIFVSL